MKKIIALFLVIFTLVFSTGSLYSCTLIDSYTSESDENSNSGKDDTVIDENLPDDDSDDNSGNNENQDKPDNNDSVDSENSNNPNDSDKPDNQDKDCSTGYHFDNDNNDYCDLCNDYLIVIIDLYVLNDLHGKFCDTDSQIGVDELGTFFNNRKEIDDHVILMATGDMWQGTAESNLTRGNILTEWMNAMGFDSMTLGNHDFDWGTSPIQQNESIADFPFLAINVYSVETGERVEYCAPSIMIERGGVQIGIIGAIGDCYSSISSDMVEDVYFEVGAQLTSLVKAESERLRSLGADFIIYQIHDGYSTDNPMTNYYASELSSGGYVDVVFESHTHQSYVKTDSYGVYHLQAGGENKGLSHVEFKINSVNGNFSFNTAEIISTSSYSNLEDDPSTEAIEEKYSDIITYAYSDLGYVSKYWDDTDIEAYVAQLYLEAGLEKWGSDYNIVLGGGFIRTRSPYDLYSGMVCYADILSLLPFDNRIVLCKISGANLNSKFINNTSSDYYYAMSDYGNSISINSSNVYFVIVDTYTALYKYNGLTIVDYFDDTTFARDLFADKVAAGELGGTAGNNGNNGGNTITPDANGFISIADALTIGNSLGDNVVTTQKYYIQGTITSIVSTKYGNMYISDKNGNKIYLYGLYDTNGTRYDSMANKPQVGDTITVYASVYKYVNGTSVIIELKDSILQ